MTAAVDGARPTVYSGDTRDGDPSLNNLPRGTGYTTRHHEPNTP